MNQSCPYCRSTPTMNVLSENASDLGLGRRPEDVCPILAKSTFTVQEPDSMLHPSWIRTGLAAQLRARVSDVASKARVQSLTGVAARLTNVARPMTSAP